MIPPSGVCLLGFVRGTTGARCALERIGRTPPEWVLNRARQRLTQDVLLDPALTFVDAAARLRNGPYARYLHHRFANPSMMAAIPIMLLLKELVQPGTRAVRVLEVGGGCGHASFLMKRYFPSLQIILTDADFVNLYLARRFMTPDATCLCLDAEARMPFKPMSVDAVFCMDAFHYVREKIGLVEELRRTLHADGLWMFPHLHNALAKNPTAGYPLSPRGYARAFAGVDMRLVSEESVLREFHEHLRIELPNSPENTLASSAQALTLVGGPDWLWQRHDLADLYQQCRPDLHLNTVYEHKADGPFSLKWPTADLHNECRLAEDFLDPEPLIYPGLLERLRDDALNHPDRDAVRTLIRNFALMPMPPRYR
jgi:SAM-dependent methyltransferase